MKKLVMLFSVLVMGHTMAQSATITSIKCTIFGNLKIKTSGIGYSGSLKTRPSTFNSCEEAQFHATRILGRSSHKVSTSVSSRILYRDTGGRSDERCEKTRVTTTRLTFDILPELTFEGDQFRRIGTYNGRCTRR
jgi:hypothetical protein